ncbi:MAG TPA: hypothetical protein VLB44_18570 [Kofleriaceae bacterium]|nr:hypothetical protein [Kofleriaceae bacterium]
MSLKQLVIVSILGCSSFAFADNASVDNQRMWTIHAADNHAELSKDSKTVTDPGVLVTSQRDPHDKK